jgi:hypothetical protein
MECFAREDGLGQAAPLRAQGMGAGSAVGEET